MIDWYLLLSLPWQIYLSVWFVLWIGGSIFWLVTSPIYEAPFNTVMWGVAMSGWPLALVMGIFLLPLIKAQERYDAKDIR